MFLYADRTVCPRCRTTLPDAGPCSSCHALLDDTRAYDVFVALQQVDRLVARLGERAVVPAAPLPAPAVAVPAPAAPIPAPVAPPAAGPAYRQSGEAPSVLSGLSVPKVLLGLGALCLVVAALVFLAVAWASLGVSGRTAVLVGFTLAATGIAAWSARAGLRAGAESLASVAFGLLVLDLAGARTSGWFGHLEGRGFVLLVGSALMVTGALATLLARRTREPRLLSTEVASSIGIVCFMIGLRTPGFLTLETWLLAMLAAAMLLTVVSWRLRLGLAVWTAAALAALTWLGLAATGLFRLTEKPSVAGLLGDAYCWPLVVAAALVAVPALVRRLPVTARVAGLAVATTLVTMLAAAPVIDEGAERVAILASAVALVHSAIAWLLRRPWSFITIASLLQAAAGLGVFLLVAGAQAAGGLLGHGFWTGSPTTHVEAPSLGSAWAVLLPLCVAAAGGITVAVARLAELPVHRVATVLVTLLIASLALAPTFIGVPALVAIAVLVVASAALAGWWLVRGDVTAGVVAGVLTTVALGASTVDDVLTIAVLALLTLVVATGETRRAPEGVRTVAPWLLPVSAATTTWAVVVTAQVSAEWQAAPVLAVLALLAVVRPATGHHVAGLGAALVAIALAAGADSSPDLRIVAGELTGLGLVTTYVGVRRTPAASLISMALLAVASLAAWPDVRTATVVLAIATGVALLHEVRAAEPAAYAGRTALPVALGALLWSAGDLAGVGQVWQAVPVVVTLGALAAWRAQVEREVPAALTAVVAVLVSLAAPAADTQAWAAVYLTLGGVAVTTSSLLHAARRRLAWLGLVLLTAATWLRLEQLGVGTVEAYTLPLAGVLLVAGTVAMLRSERSSLRTQGPGLALALVPTLLQAIADPLTLRGVLLGAGCLLLVGAGAGKRWAAPLVAGSATLALLVVRQVVDAQQLPQWALIGLAGAVLTFVGLTWEKRLAGVRAAAGYVRGLR